MSVHTLSPQEMAEACAKAMWADDNATRHLEMSLGPVAPGEASMAMSVASFMANGHNTCHGGYIFTLADSAFAFACNTYNQRTVAQHVSITYIAPAMMGDRLTAKGREISRRGRGGIYDVQVTNQNGEVIAEFRGHARTVKGTLLPES